DGEGAHAAPAVARTRRATRAGGRGRGTGDDARAQAKDARVVCGGPCERAPAARATEDTGATDVVAVGADTGRCSVVSREGERMSTGRELAVIEPATGELVHEYVAPQPMTFAEVVDRLATDEALEQQRQLMTAYDRACRALISENDIQREGRREFKKKSAWRKLARAFAISTQIVRIERWWDEDPNGARHFVARVIVRGVAPWGQSVEAVGLCSTRETRFRSNA